LPKCQTKEKTKIDHLSKSYVAHNTMTAYRRLSKFLRVQNNPLQKVITFVKTSQ